MGSTFPLLEMEDTRFSRMGGTAEILATGWRPLRRTRAKASRAAKTRNITMRFRSLRSIAPYSDCRGLARPESLIVTTGAEVPLGMMSMRKGFSLMDAWRRRWDARVSRRVARKHGHE